VAAPGDLSNPNDTRVPHPVNATACGNALTCLCRPRQCIQIAFLCTQLFPPLCRLIACAMMLGFRDLGLPQRPNSAFPSSSSLQPPTLVFTISPAATSQMIHAAPGACFIRNTPPGLCCRTIRCPLGIVIIRHDVHVVHQRKSRACVSQPPSIGHSSPPPSKSLQAPRCA